MKKITLKTIPTFDTILRNSISPATARHPFVLVALALACFALSPQAQAVCQDACLTNFNTVQGDDALFSLTTGINNTAIGFEALYSNTTGFENTATGVGALFSNTTGGGNTANGNGALNKNTTGSSNTATGGAALGFNTTGSNNTATGYEALFSNNSSANTANGFDALFNNTTGGGNTAIGVSALYSNTTGVQNTAVGAVALFSNATGTENTATGVNACANTTGFHNTANGFDALFNNTTGSDNIALGYRAGTQITGDNNIDIGNEGVAGESNTIRIGTQGTQTAAYIAGVSGGAVAGSAVKVNAAGKIGTAPSSVRFKQNVKSMGDMSDALFALRPVTFRYKQEIDPEGIPQFGLVAEEVEKVNPTLVDRGADGKLYTVRYEAVNAMLLNEFLKEHREVQEQKATITQLKSSALKQEATIAKQQKQIEALATGLQKVSDQGEMNRSAPKMVVNNQ